MNKRVRALDHMQGDYGFKQRDDIFIIAPNLAEQLEDRGLIEIIEDTDEEPYKPTSGGIRFTPHQKAAGDKPAGETDRNNPTIG